MLSSTASTTKEAISLSPVTSTAISLEYASLRHRGHCPLGMYVVPSEEDLLVWHGVLFIHKGYYTDAVLRFRIDFPFTYPDAPPTVHFISDVFHPLVSVDGRFNLAPRFRPWRPKEHHVFDILHFIKSAFKKHALDAVSLLDCLNKESFRLYHESTSSFAALTLQTAVLSQSKSALFDRDHPSMTGKNSGIVFKNLKPDQLKEGRTKILGLREWDELKR